MKKIILTIFIIILLIISIFKLIYSSKENNNKNITTLKVAEVTHSPFYTPFYVALENNYFKDEGLNIELSLTPGADKVTAAVISKSVDIGFAGPESTIYIYNEGKEDYLVSFAGLTKKDGQFIVSRKKDFKWEDLQNKEILVGRIGGMPALNFLNALDKLGISKDNIKINYDVDYASLSGAFIGGNGDFVNLFEPNASNIEKNGYGFIVESIGKNEDTMPYTAFYTTKSFLDNNKETLQKYNNALNKGLEYIKKHNSHDIAMIIKNQFSDIDTKDLEKYIDNYKDIDSWYDNTFIPEEDFKSLQKLLIKNKLIDKEVPYNILVNNI